MCDCVFVYYQNFTIRDRECFPDQECFVCIFNVFSDLIGADSKSSEHAAEYVYSSFHVIVTVYNYSETFMPYTSWIVLP